jgi:hypothetical protein
MNETDIVNQLEQLLPSPYLNDGVKDIVRKAIVEIVKLDLNNAQLSRNYNSLIETHAKALEEMAKIIDEKN